MKFSIQHQRALVGNDPESEPLVIIDESSMLDLPLMYSLACALPVRARLLLVGDPHQLPPIGFGLIFHIIAASSNVPRVDSSGVSFIDAGDHEIIDCVLRVLAEWSDCDDLQVLGVTKGGGRNGIRNLNSTLQALGSVTRKGLRAWAFAEGDPIIYLVNDYNKRLWNGSLGRIESIVTGANGKPALLCRLEEAKHEIREDDFHNIDLAYAITVHKAQGSQFKKVIVPIIRSRLLDRTLIYTAMTRGIEQVVFIGDRGTFVRAIVRHSHCSDRSASRYKSEA